MKVSVMRIMLSAVAALAVTGFVSATTDGDEAQEVDAKSDVVVLTTDTFKEWTAAQDLALIEFYAPWCGHCKSLAPEYEKAATILKDKNISLAKVDCTNAQALCEEMEIPGFPTLKVSKNGDFATYNGTRKESGIVSYMSKQLLPALSVLDQDNFATFTKSERVVVVGFVEDAESPEYAELELLAKELRDDLLFGVVKNSEMAAEHGITGPGVVVYKEFDDGKDVFSGKITADELRNFIKASSVPIFGEISGENYAMYAQTGLPFGFAFFDSEETRKELEEQLYPVAKEYKGVISFVLIDATKYSSQADHLNLKHDWPAFAIQNQTSLEKYPFPQDKELTETSVQDFVKDFAAGNIKPSYKSAAIPESNDGNVFVMVTDQFNEVVFDKTKDVLLEFYAPWCGHCKNLAPVYEKLGGLLKQNKNLVVAKMDATANDIPSAEPALQVGGFPTIVIIRGEDNAIVEYNGNRSLESLIEFIEENAANSITYDKNELKSADEEDEVEEEEEAEDTKPKVVDQAEAEAEAEVVVEDKNSHDEL
ncbi:protein disulfide-isomerase precursor [Coemansia aciculifera]|uniref:Protein disulfide-isomerase n=1 Tax=Coemansia aciculifera TaxID=417176 RepID=A0ACC1M8X9_9FUNG|nr:protein disulfide-isomerase precursor [Coemansia aciculifera]